MSHQAIYRKFRPKTFDDVLGQEHVTRTLKNQIMTDNIAHAYLFSGIRGTGKTSTAKIFSRAVNCLNNHDGNPCNECEICKSILNETNMDVIEMDAASNNGVEDIRELRDKVKFLPVKSRYKVYIIDEVHMLSKGAFNALLKTLEEPPEHLLFILATTEPQKIPATILSRCQRFDLKRIKSDVIVENMKSICEEIGIEYDEKALSLIAANSEGAMRDAQSILDRCISFNEDKIDYETVINLLGTVNYQVVLEAANYMVDKDIKSTMVLVDDILNRGKEILSFLDELIVCFRNMMIIKSTGLTDNIIRMSEEEAGDLKKLSNRVSIDEIVEFIEELSSAQLECKRALNPRVLLEAKLIKMLNKVEDLNIGSLINRIEELENSIKNGNTATVIKTKPPAGRHVAAETRKKSAPAGNALNPENFEIKKQDTSEKIVKEEQFENKSDEAIYNAIINNWQAILKKVRSENAGLQAIIRESRLHEVKNKKAVFEFDPKFTFHINAANQPKNKVKFKEVLSGILNEECEVEFTIKKDEKPIKPKHTIEDIYEDVVREFGEEIVEFKQED
ncbi:MULTISPECIES: DNA polymerase III subunit gamma/tau [unclassified Sedimentibacter]|uniref:DNA polymerase III subunit gamma/tau n=1 Tax=unclassified Sedimentibacter TaxID=2649220 RepID=UPI0027E175AE|nr:DNA polymerase III subunit gamma/tau [Sedimentibacter sp. MB35-C1]WMJ78256.1 DNA polymerase III subunit gamma/tau [Sedimentibacter sp. MB35-C1]